MLLDNYYYLKIGRLVSVKINFQKAKINNQS